MKAHRSTHSNVSNNPQSDKPDSFRPADALESLHTQLVQLEVFAHLAGEVMTRLSPPSDYEQRREYIRLYALVTKVADDAIAAVSHGDALISALSAHLSARLSQRPEAASAEM